MDGRKSLTKSLTESAITAHKTSVCITKQWYSSVGIGSGSAASKDLDGQDSLTAALSKKAQQRRAHKLAKHMPKGSSLLLLCWFDSLLV